MAAARRGKLTEAERLARQSYAAATEVAQVARLANLLGGIAFERGRLEEAEVWLEAVIRSAGPANLPLLAGRATNNLASIAHIRGKRLLALSLYRSALVVWQRENDAIGEAQTCHNLGMVAREDGALAQAAEYAERAVLAARRTEDSALEGLVLIGRGEIALAREDLESAGRDLAAARSLASRTGDALGLGEADRLAGRIALAEGRPDEALRLARSGYRQAKRLHAVQLAAECAELCTLASEALRRGGWVARYRATAVRHYTALGASLALRRLAAEAGA
jgi:tetratricopeptide (TPR) repeat protein